VPRGEKSPVSRGQSKMRPGENQERGEKTKNDAKREKEYAQTLERACRDRTEGGDVEERRRKLPTKAL